MARPRKDAQTARATRFNLRLTAAERARLDEAARAAGQSPTDYARARLLGPEEVPRFVVPVRHQVDPAIVVALNRIGANLNQLARRANSGDMLQPGELPEVLAALRSERNATEHLVLRLIDA